MNFRKKLLAMQAELQDIAGTGEASTAVVELDQAKVGRLSRMDALQAQAMAQASRSRRHAMLAKISAALERIDNGDFGACSACEKPINPKRLEVDPTASLCIECASRSER